MPLHADRDFDPETDLAAVHRLICTAVRVQAGRSTCRTRGHRLLIQTPAWRRPSRRASLTWAVAWRLMMRHWTLRFKLSSRQRLQLAWRTCLRLRMPMQVGVALCRAMLTVKPTPSSASSIQTRGRTGHILAMVSRSTAAIMSATRCVLRMRRKRTQAIACLGTRAYSPCRTPRII